MTRIRLESNPGQAHELTFSCAGRRPYLRDPEIAQAFLDLLDQARHEANFALHAYVVMPEHCHLTVRPLADDVSMSDILTAIKSPATKEILRLRPHIREEVRVVRRGRKDDFAFWLRGGGYDKPITTAEGFRSMIRYIHANPVRRRLSEGELDYPYSSAPAYWGGTPPIPVDIPDLSG